MRKPVLAITMGDPGGVGPEVTLGSLKGLERSKDFHCCVIGIPEVWEFAARAQNADIPFERITQFDPAAFKTDRIYFWDVTAQADAICKELARRTSFCKTGTFDIGRVSPVNAAAAYAALQGAALAAAKGMIEALVTAPVNKTAMRLIDGGFQGHTELLAGTSGASRYAMMFVHDRLKVTLATIHVALKDVSAQITSPLVFEKIALTDRFLKTYFNIKKPKLAVCALNPHGQETGSEDEAEIRPAVARAREQKIEACGPFSADQIFFDAYEGRYDAVISMYHDQGLAPFKMIAFRDGVNVTLGLPYIRTSPDHGTAFDIAYQGKADSRSMQAAVRLALRLMRPGMKETDAVTD